MRDRHVYTFDGFSKNIKEAFGTGSNIFIQPLDYKSYYDQFIDKRLVVKYSRMDFTQLYFKIQPSQLSYMEAGSTNPGSNKFISAHKLSQIWSGIYCISARKSYYKRRTLS